MSLPKVSIITIVFNGIDTLEKTILSITNQTYPNIEYIIVDGASTDGTIDLIKAHSNVITRWISEPDKGLYDAMNKGIDLATGDYLWFINSGDVIFAPTTLSQIFNNNKIADIYYGDTVMIGNDGNEIGKRRLSPPKNLNWKQFSLSFFGRL
jgi:glycosyltransferase involved in cell wall biosynthesis